MLIVTYNTITTILPRQTGGMLWYRVTVGPWLYSVNIQGVTLDLSVMHANYCYCCHLSIKNSYLYCLFFPSHCMAIELQRYHVRPWKMLGTRNRNGKRNAMTWYSSITYFNLNWINTTWQVAMNYSLFYFSIRCFLLHDVWLVDCLCLNLVKYLNKVGGHLLNII